MTRKRLKAPLGWDSTTEQTANVVDAITYLTRLFSNVNSEQPNLDPVPRVPRPFEAIAADLVAMETISLADFNDLLKEN